MSRFSDPADSPGFLLWHATLRWQRLVTAALAPHRLTHPQFVLLACASWLDSGDGVRQVDVARQAGTDAVTTSEVLRRLEAKGMLRREPDPSDARARRIRVTPEGTRTANAAMAAVEEVDGAFFADAGRGLRAGLRRASGVDAD